MDTEQLWNRFTQSGKIDDYIKYITQKGLCNDNSRGNCTERTDIR